MQRAARWLLTTRDRVGRDEFPLTQQFLAQMLGVRRPTVSEIASRLQEAGLIRYTRGIVTIADRARSPTRTWTTRAAASGCAATGISRRIPRRSISCMGLAGCDFTVRGYRGVGRADAGVGLVIDAAGAG